MSIDNLDLFNTVRALPEGLRYIAEFISPEEEQTLVETFASLPFKEFEFHGYLGKRRVVSFGWRYNYGKRVTTAADPIPEFLLPLRERAARFAELPAQELQQTLITEYTPGAGIGWHRDRAVFGEVVGISLLSSCTLRFRRPIADGWERRTLTPQPRSAYLLQGPARTQWAHSIPPVRSLRYSVTFRRHLVR